MSAASCISSASTLPLGASASAPHLFKTTPQTQQRRMQSENSSFTTVPLAVEEWATRCLDDDTAPLLASLAWAQREASELVDQERWQAVTMVCDEVGLSLERLPEPAAAAEREQSRIADNALAGGPVAISLQPPETGLALASSGSVLAVAEQRYGTFGSGRDEAPIDPSTRNAALLPLASLSRPGTSNALRFRLPGPGSYSPELDGRPYKLETSGFVNGVTFGREDRYKHLTRTNRPKGQYTALPLQCGPAPGFYSNPKFGGPKERAVPGARCQAKMFMPSSELPAGLPPERNRRHVLEVRKLNAKGNSSPAPNAYETLGAASHYSEHQTKLAGRWASEGFGGEREFAPHTFGGSPPSTADAPGSPPATASAAGVFSSHGPPSPTDHGKGFFLPARAPSPSKVSPGYTPMGGRTRSNPDGAMVAGGGGRRATGSERVDTEEAVSMEGIKKQSAAIKTDARDRRLDLRNRAVVEDQLDRVRQGHKLLAAGAKRQVGGLKTKKPLDASVGGQLRARLDGSFQRVSDLFKGFDSSWDGLVSRSEFSAALTALEVFTTQAEFDELFDAIDADGSGEIDFAELRRHLMHRPGQARAARAPVEDISPIAFAGSCTSNLNGPARIVEWPVRPCAASCWSSSPGRDLSIQLMQGIEPPERRSLGPATYDPRYGSAAVKPKVSVGGAALTGTRKPLMPTPYGEYFYAAMPDEAHPSCGASDASLRMSQRADTAASSEPGAVGASTPSPHAAADQSGQLPPRTAPARSSPSKKGRKADKRYSGNQAVQVLRSTQGTFLRPA